MVYSAIEAKVSHWDYVAIVIYFGCVLACGFWAMCRTNRGSLSGYFLAGRFMTFIPVGASLFASNIGSEHFIGLAGSGAADGIGVGAFELNALIILQLLGWVMLPVYIASGVSTLPEFMNKRFGGQRIRVYLAVLSLVLYVFTKISVNMYAGSLFVSEALGWNLYLGILLVLAMTAICTVTGGLAAVIYTDTLQCLLMIVGSGGLAIYSLWLVGGYPGLMEKYMSSVSNDTLLSNNTCGYPNKKSFTMLRDPWDKDYPWVGFLLGQSPASIWYWAADQMIVQRVLAAKSLSHAQGATLFAGYLKILPLFLIVLPGMVSRVLYPDTIACSTNCAEICGNPISCTNYAYPKLVVSLMPDGARGIMLAVMLAALISDLTSIFNSAATLFTIDIWHRIRPDATQKQMLIVGRVWVLVMVGVSIAWVPIVQQLQGGQLFIYIQAVSAYLSPPIAAVYLLALLWPRCNEIGAFWALMCGFLVGIVRMVLDFIYTAPPCGYADNRPVIIAKVQYMYFALILFSFTLTVAIFISNITPALPEWMLIRTTFWTRKSRALRLDESTPPRFEDDSIELQKQHNAHKSVLVSSRADQRQSDDDDIPDSPPVEDSNKDFLVQHEPIEIMVKRRVLFAISWFCGFNEMTSDQHDELQHNPGSLYQTKKEQIVLSCNLIFILCVAVFLFIFFSIESPITSAF